MADVLDAIIDLNDSIVNNDLELAKSSVEIINNDQEDLKDRFDINEVDIGSYFGMYDLIYRFLNDATEYVLNNLKGLDESLRTKCLWSLKTSKLIENRDNTAIIEFIKNTINNESTLKDYQRITLMRMINICQDYDLFALLKGKGE